MRKGPWYIEGGVMKKLDRFQSPYEQFSHKVGQKFDILGEVPRHDFDYKEIGPLYLIKLEDGDIIQAWPEEIYDNDF